MSVEMLSAKQDLKQSQKILLVEDDFVLKQVHQIFLKQLGYEVTWVETGEEALDYSERGQYDAMVLDLGLPGISGEFVLSAIRCREFSTQKRLPILVATAHGTEADLVKCRDLGADEALIKPVSIKQFRQSLKEILAYNK